LILSFVNNFQNGLRKSKTLRKEKDHKEEMRVYDFVKMRGIEFYWTYLKFVDLPNGKTKKAFISYSQDNYSYPDGKRDPTHFKTNPDLIKNQMKYFENNMKIIYNIAEDNGWKVGLMLNTFHVRQLDVDHPDCEGVIKDLQEKLPYYCSMTKKLPHFFFTTDYVFSSESSTPYANKDFDLLHGTPGLADPSAPMFNYHNPFSFDDFSYWIQDYQKDTKTSRTTSPTVSVSLSSCSSSSSLCSYVSSTSKSDLSKLLQCLDTQRADNYHDWFRVLCATKSSNDPNALEEFETFSKQSTKYDASSFEEGGKDYRLWQNVKPRMTINSLHYWAKQDNPELYDTFFGNSYEVVKKQYEFRLFKLGSPVRFVCLENDDGTDFDLLTRSDLQTKLEDVFYTCQTTDDNGNSTTKKKSFFKRWIEDPSKRYYNKIVFDPSGSFYVNGNYNLYRGLEIHQLQGATYNQKYVDMIREYLLNRICGGHAEFTEFFIKWQAWIVQRPHMKTRVCIVFKSPVEGTGKGMFVEFFGNKIIGSRYFIPTPRPASVLGKFNGIVEQKLLVNFNEIEFKDTYDKQGSLNVLITDPTIEIERKGKDAIKYENNLNFIATTNKDNPFPLSHNDRRYACVESFSPAMTAEEVTFYADFFEKENVAFSWYSYLMSVQLPSSLSHTRPITPFYKECKILTASPYISFWLHQLNKFNQPIPTRHFFTFETLYDDFRHWRAYFHNSNDPIEKYRAFCIKIRKFPYITAKRCRIEKQDKMGISVEIGALMEHLKDYGPPSENLPYAEADELGDYAVDE
jgi:hypothetical protein